MGKALAECAGPLALEGSPLAQELPRPLFWDCGKVVEGHNQGGLVVSEAVLGASKERWYFPNIGPRKGRSKSEMKFL